MALSKILPASQVQYAGARNLIINGAMTVSQRGVDINSLGETAYSTDRFRTRTYGGNGRFDYDQVTDVVPSSTFKYAAKYTVSTAATDVGSFGYSVQQVIEGHNIAQLRIGRSDAKPFTISFWARSSVSGTYSSGVATASGDISFVTEFTLVANTWKYISYTVPAYTTSVPTNLNETNGSGLFFTVIGLASQTSKQTSTLDAWQSGNFAFSSNQTNFMSATTRTVHITGVQMEVGDVATPFEHESYGDTLLKCQRYFEICGWVPRTDNLLACVDYKVEKRAQSTIAVVSSDSAGFSVSVNELRDSRQGFYQSANASHTTRVTMSSDAEL